MTEKVDGRHFRKRQRPKRHPLPGSPEDERSRRMKDRWEDPVQREFLLEQNRRNARDPNRPTRFGTFDGLTREESALAWAAARAKAETIVEKMKANGTLDDIHPDAVKALKGAIEVLESPTNQGTKLAAARLVLDFRMSKPTSKAEITVNKAEEWLAAVSEDDDGREAPSDTEASA